MRKTEPLIPFPCIAKLYQCTTNVPLSSRPLFVQPVMAVFLARLHHGQGQKVVSGAYCNSYNCREEVRHKHI